MHIVGYVLHKYFPFICLHRGRPVITNTVMLRPTYLKYMVMCPTSAPTTWRNE